MVLKKHSRAVKIFTVTKHILKGKDNSTCKAHASFPIICTVVFTNVHSLHLLN